MADVSSKMDKQFSQLEEDLDAKLRLVGFNKAASRNANLLRMMERQGHRQVGVGMSELRDKARGGRGEFDAVNYQ